MRTPADLRPYQRRGARRAYRSSAAGLLIDMSLGKTVITLSAIRGLIKAGKRTAALVVVPLRVLETETWQKEAAGWSHTKNLRFSLVYGKEKERLRALAEPADVYLTNYETLKWLAQQVGTRSRPGPLRLRADILALDESSMIQNANSMRFKALRLRLRRFFKTFLILTGTPMPNSLLQFWSQIYVLDSGARLGTSFDRFKSRFFEQMDYHGHRWEPREGAVERVMQLISDITLRLDAADWVKLPEIIYNEVEILLPESARRMYDTHEAEMFTELENGGSFEAVSAATLSMQCHQLANGAIYDNEEDRTSWSEVHHAKLDALQEIIDGHPGQRLIVAYWFRHDLQRLRERWPAAAVMQRGNAKQIEDQWNAGKLPLLFMQPQGSSHGLNMQFGGHILALFSMMWSFEKYFQLIHRLRRPDNESDKIIVHHLIAKDTVDEVMLQTLQQRGHTQRTALNLLRAYARRRGMVP